MEMLQLNDLHKTFNPGTVNEKVALNGVSLHMEAGDFATIVGSNGAGKSTLFNAITGGFIADEGSIVLGGQDITFEPEHQRSKVNAWRWPPDSRPTGCFIRSSRPMSSRESFSRNSSLSLREMREKMA